MTVTKLIKAKSLFSVLPSVRPPSIQWLLFFFCVFQGRNWIFRENYLFGLFMFINQSSKYIYCCRRGWPNDKYVFKMTTNLLKRTTMCYLKNVQHIATFTNYFRQACNLFFFANWKKSNFENFYWNITLDIYFCPHHLPGPHTLDSRV